MALLPLSKNTIVDNVILACLAVVAVFLRLLSLRRKGIRLKADDYVIVFALVLVVGLCTVGVWAGATNLLAEVNLPLLDNLERWADLGRVVWIDVFVSTFAFGVIKISVLLFYRRIFITRGFKLAADILMGIIVCWTTGGMTAHFFSTKPVDIWWRFPSGYNPIYNFKNTINYGCFLTTMACMNMLFDILVLVLPIPVIRGLQISKERMTSLLAVFGLGAFCVVASAVRINYCYRLWMVWTGRTPLIELTTVICWNEVWAHIELCSSIVAACLPTLAPLLGVAVAVNKVRLFYRRISSSIASSLKSTERKSKPSISVNSQCSTEHLRAGDQWLKMSTVVEVCAIHPPAKLPDEEAFQIRPHSIHVSRSFSHRYEQRY